MTVAQIARASTPRRMPDVEPNAPDRLTAAMALMPLRLFLAAGWVRAGVEKMIEPSWWTGDDLRAFLVTQHDVAISFFQPFMDSVVAPMAMEIAAVVAVTEIMIGVAIGIGKPLRLALWWGIVLNVSFVLAGRVNPSAFYLIMQIVLLQAIAEGLLVRSARRPANWALAAAVGWFLTALHFIPYVHTIEPAEVIEDPAMMLLFLSVVVGVMCLLRWLRSDGEVVEPSVARTGWLDAWVRARDGRDRHDRAGELEPRFDHGRPRDQLDGLTQLYVDDVLVDLFEPVPESVGS